MVSGNRLPLMDKEFCLPLFGILELRYHLVQLLRLALATNIDFFLLLRTQFVVNFLSDLDFEADGDVRTGSSRRTWGRVVLVRQHMRMLFLFPPGDDDLAKTRVPSISAVSLGGGELPLLALVES